MENCAGRAGIARTIKYHCLHLTLATGIVAASALVLPTLSVAGGEVNIYSYRQPELIQPLLDNFTAISGVETNVVFLNKGLVERVRSEGRNSPVDVILTVDIGRLDQAQAAGITQSVTSAVISNNIPVHYRDPAGHWFGVTTRARIVYASKDRVAQDAITYEELADPKWRGKICTRSGQHDYTIGLIASMIANLGAEKAEAWLTGVRANLARKPQGNDRAQAKAIFSGECDIALGNHYYVGQMITNEKEPEQKEWAAAIKVLFPNADGRGSHVNISGMAMAANAPNRDNALLLMNYLSSGPAQEIYASQVFEYPVKDGFSPVPLIADLGTLKADTLPIADIAKYRKAASEMVDRVGFNDGPSS